MQLPKLDKTFEGSPSQLLHTQQQAEQAACNHPYILAVGACWSDIQPEQTVAGSARG